MAVRNLLEQYFLVVGREKLWTKPAYLRFYLRYLFESVSLTGKTLLDIGGGGGLFSLYAACAGATRVVCLEPEHAGSSTGMQDRFRHLSALLEVDHARMLPATFQEYDPGGDTYDVILLHNSINHLDEAACVDLHRSREARETYRALFGKMYSMMNPGGTLILADCSKYNFFNLLRMKSPLMPMIEWHKHQSPRLWSQLAIEAGFCRLRTRWTSLNRLGSPGRVMLGNRYAAFFLLSHFCLTAGKEHSSMEAAGCPIRNGAGAAGGNGGGAIRG